jgi:hypothetical protein
MYNGNNRTRPNTDDAKLDRDSPGQGGRSTQAYPSYPPRNLSTFERNSATPWHDTIGTKLPKSPPMETYRFPDG